MKIIFLLFDSLRKLALSPYGCDWVHTPNFERLSRQSVTYDNCYVASLPCMPARRDFHTGRVNFLHRSWGPMEPFDNSVISILSQNGIYTHIISDHIHYWEEGGCNYHTKYDSWEIVRGQEGDKWIPSIDKPNIDNTMGRKDEARIQDIVNREYMMKTQEYPMDNLFSKAFDFLENNHKKDNWFLQIESFDPHEPFFAHEEYRQLYPHEYDGGNFDWPDYKIANEPPEAVQHCKYEYAALVSQCDAYLGKLLDFMDAHDMWDDTMLIVTTDHGYLLGEHGWWAKTVQPVYNEVSNTPFFIWDPVTKEKGYHSDNLIQITDVAPTLLNYCNIAIPGEMTGQPINNKPFNKNNKQGCLFGLHGCYLNVTDGKYVYMKRPLDVKGCLFNYTLMPNHMKKAFSFEEFAGMEIVEPFTFTKDYPMLKIPAQPWADIDFDKYGDLLFCIENEPKQLSTIDNKEVEHRMAEIMVELMIQYDAPKESYAYWGLIDIYNLVIQKRGQQ